MNKPDFDAAVKAAEEFLEQAKRITWEDHPFLPDGMMCVDSKKTSPRETGALKRRSMDLTRALADLRHPYRQSK